MVFGMIMFCFFCIFASMFTAFILTFEVWPRIVIFCAVTKGKFVIMKLLIKNFEFKAAFFTLFLNNKDADEVFKETLRMDDENRRKD
jgi:hypothetical protein